MNCTYPTAAQAIGIAKAIRTELGAQYHTMLISMANFYFIELVRNVFHKIRRENNNEAMASDKGFVVDNGIIYVG